MVICEQNVLRCFSVPTEIISKGTGKKKKRKITRETLPLSPRFELYNIVLLNTNLIEYTRFENIK